MILETKGYNKIRYQSIINYNNSTYYYYIYENPKKKMFISLLGRGVPKFDNENSKYILTVDNSSYFLSYESAFRDAIEWFRNMTDLPFYNFPEINEGNTF